MKKLNIVIAGGGSTYTPGITSAILSHIERFPMAEIRLYDNDSKRNEDMGLIINQLLIEQNQTDIELITTENPEEAFSGADFIFSQIRVGGLKMREQDEKIPLKYGLVGQETCGLGGFAYGLRSIKGILELVGYIQEYAPDAWVLNYTNPETLVGEAIRRVYPGIRMINVCDMTISIEETIAENYDYDRKNWVPTYFGLNHYGWYTEIYDKSLGRDVMPEIIEKMRAKSMNVAEFNEGDQTWAEAFKMMSTMVEYFPDYLPNNYLEYYLFPDVVVEKSDPSYTRANMVMEGREKNTREMARKIRDGETENVLNFNFGEHGNYIVDIATSLLNDEHRRFMVITPNRGSIPNLRQDAVVEVPAYIGATGIEPIALDPIIDFHKGLMEAQVAAEKLLVDAYFEGSYQKALQAFTLNQSVNSAYLAKQVLDEMIEANKGYWPELN
ncbi:maltose-6'-phosphate glucosidase [Marinilactibacillus sp. GCM10026970]|uniref:family 4 glycosyl hydrolase n=1 Tax=Marinilactibacillus sp. GCM10026970 TaxID=3252642 RepID=UPI00360FC24A